ncbi:MAG TPA: hypothetical protein VH143_34395 [Kofleriaceae bacterium]|jgi:hypothetical protein|nr:hypothetical protein [Kofleriaceae bacterium]
MRWRPPVVGCGCVGDGFALAGDDAQDIELEQREVARRVRLDRCCSTATSPVAYQR